VDDLRLQLTEQGDGGVRGGEGRDREGAGNGDCER